MASDGAAGTLEGSLAPEEIRYLSIEGGGVAGFTVQPGALRALDELGVLRYSESMRLEGVEALAGSSSGAVIALLVSCGYTHDEVDAILSPEAMDLVFRLDTIQLGRFVRIGGRCTEEDPRPGVATGFPMPSRDPLGAFLLGALAFDTWWQKWVLDPTRLRDVYSEQLSARIEQLEGWRDGVPDWFQERGAKAAAELATRRDAVVGVWTNESFESIIAKEYAEAYARTVHMALDPASSPSSTQSNLANVFRQDFGLYSGCAWRDYLDIVVAFARLRVRHSHLFGDLRVPGASKFRQCRTLYEPFEQVIKAAAALLPATAPQPGWVAVMTSLRGCDFRQHAADFFPNRPVGGPAPLSTTGANLTTQASEIFSADTTPYFRVSDAVRIATSIPPVLKPVIIGRQDIPPTWSDARERTGTDSWLVGYWIDGGLYANSPMDLLLPHETPGNRVLGIGIGFDKPRSIQNVTDFYTSLINVVYERNISATRVPLDQFVSVDKFGIGTTTPTLTANERRLYQADAWWRIYQYFGEDPAGQF